MLKMGRSKFPGKPAKHGNRTRVNVLGASATAYNHVAAAAANNGAGGGTATNGHAAAAAAASPAAAVAAEDHHRRSAADDVEEDADEHDVQENNDDTTTIAEPSPTYKTRASAAARKKNLSMMRSPLKKRTRLLSAGGSGAVTLRSRRAAGPLNRSLKKDGGAGGKFVLPSRSAHSSRVIKPNKRFLSVDQETRIIRKRVKRQCVVNSEQQTVHASGDAPANTSDTVISANETSVVLRQARLQLNSSSTLSTDGPFSTPSPTSTSTSTSPRTITCGVCGAVRFYRLTKHARKFNIYACEACRKFIAKSIKLASAEETLTCIKGQGFCHVSPNWKFGGEYSTRCPACWLKLCLRSFQLPATLKSNLLLLLPKYMQPGETSLFGNSLNTPLLTWQSPELAGRTSSPLAEMPARSSEMVVRRRPERAVKRMTAAVERRVRPVRLKQLPVAKVPKAPTPPPPPPPVVDVVKRAKIDLKGPRVKHVCRSASIVLGQLPATFPAEKETKSPALSPILKDKTAETTETPVRPTKSVKFDLPELPLDENKPVKLTKEAKLSTPAGDIQTPIIDSVKDVEKETQKQQVVKETPALSMLPMEMIKPSFNRKCKKIQTQEENPNLLNIDFWENYDPEEIVSNGYSLIASEAFPMRAICFLCGSAGKEALVHCCLCCEPYHPYCLEQGPPAFASDAQKFTWVCPKCTKCSACGEADKQKIYCQKCHKAYHPQCFNHKWRTDDRPTVCSNCLRCKSCGTDNITKFVGNLALCLACFKLRNKGNYCPLCQCCYDDNDFDTKMMECGKCNKWIHAKCERLSDEHYQILSILPESVEFVCCLCTSEAMPFWRKAVQQELRSCLNNILRLMSKNRVAREALRLSPTKTPSSAAASGAVIVSHLPSARRLEFVDTSSSSSFDGETARQETDVSTDAADNQLELAVFKNKIDFGDSFNNSATLMNDSKLPMSPRMVEIKNKLIANEYASLYEFNVDMESALRANADRKLIEVYHEILKKIVPWFDPSATEDLNVTVDASRLDASKIEDGDTKKSAFEAFEFPSAGKTPRVDTRACNLCKGLGDGVPEKEARLLYCGQNEWVHSNCALWSSEVYEEIDGSLQNVQAAITRGRSIRCSHCKQKGASVGCCRKGCYETYHFPCAQTAECHFIADRTMYCHAHEIPADLNLIAEPSEFAIRRAVYIELETKKKRLWDRDRVHYMVGALSVINLGRVVPNVSDTVDAIIPVGFVCSRLFWSTTEPWKLIPYKITTSIYNAHAESYVDKNFTVDHSLPRHMVERRLREIQQWQKDDRDRSDIYEFEDYEEPQNAGDILSPELTDAILEELPHDLLEGLSMQEMLKEYEELMNLEFKNTDMSSGEGITLNAVTKDEKDAIGDEKDVGETTAAATSVRELKRSKSEVFQKIEDKLKPRNQQRSCSLAYLQLDTTLSPAMKKRKIAAPAASFMQIVQVDGACDSGSECGSPTREIEDVWSGAIEGDVKCGKCHCTYRTKSSYERHLQHCDAMFTSESETEEIINTSVEELQQQQQQQSVIYESFSYQATANQIQSTMLNSTILESKTQVQDAGSIIYNYQTVKPMSTASTTANLVDGASLINTTQFCHAAPSNSCLIPMDSGAQVINQINPMIEPVTLQSVPYAATSDVTPFINLGQHNPSITIDAKDLASVLNLQQTTWARPQMAAQKPRCMPKPRVVAMKKPQAQPQQQQRMVQVLPAPNSQSLIVQHIPSTNMFMEASSFQQQSVSNHQGVQYVVTPQVPSAPTAQLVQLPDNNFLSLVQNVPQLQPTMIIQQPRVETGQIIVDSNGSAMLWTQPIQQVQPVYYGIETVQTTVMQSQQFLPTTMPGMLATNSSYSATTQVFQTSKLEPVLDGGYVFVNQNQLLNQNQVQVQVPHIQTSVSNCPSIQIKSVPVTSTPIVSTHSSSATHIPPTRLPSAATPIHQITVTPTRGSAAPAPIQLSPQLPPITPPQLKTVPISPPIRTTPITVQITAPASVTSPPQPTIAVPVTTWNTMSAEPALKPPLAVVSTPAPVVAASTNSTLSNTNSITLPVAPFVPEQGIPTNIVTPTPKPPTIPVQSRPMSRVLPMQTSATQKKPSVEPTLIEKAPQSKLIITSDIVITTKPRAREVVPETQVTNYKVAVTKEMKEAKIPLPEIKQEQLLPAVKPKEEEMTKPLAVHIETTPPPALKEQKLKKPEDKDKEREGLKINKIHVAPLRTQKPKAPSSTANKENLLCENLQEPKYAKRQNPPISIYFKIESADGRFVDAATSLPQIWRKVFGEVQTARAAHNLPPLPDIALRAFNEADLLGLKTNSMRFLTEQLPDAARCKQYKPLYHTPKDPYVFDEDDDEDSARRCVAYDTKREKYDMFGWLASKHRTLDMYDLDAMMKKNASSSLPMAMRFRALRVTSKYSVGVYRSEIHGRGLFSLREIDSGEMVIEYAGEVIRSVLTDKREKYYNTKGIGCYMFRIDDNLVVDATMKGNAARFINHSCDPNCYSKVVEILGNKHIIIFALRRIICGEELTYDYKFPFEEDKIPCTCGAKRCRKFLN